MLFIAKIYGVELNINTMKNKYIVGGIVVVIIIIIIAVAFSFSSSSSSNTIKIGGLYPLTGGLASYGEPAHNMADVAVADINAAGGINGKQLELVSQDDQCDPKAALSAFQQMTSSGLKVFSIVACSGTVSSIAPTLQPNSAVMIGTVTSANSLTGISPYFFRNWASDGQEAQLLADRAIAQKYKSIGVIYENTAYAKGLEISLASDLKNSNISVDGESFDSGTTDVRTQLTKLQALKPDVLFVSVQTVTSGETILSQMEQLGYHPSVMFINDNILKSATLLSKHSSLLEGAVGGDYVFQASPELNNALAEYKAKYGNDCPQINICAAEYDAIQLLAKAISTSGVSTDGIKSYLSQANYSGLSGTISFDSNNDRTNAHYSLFIVKSGRATQI
jgi:branched-chain amino acid transport system substrate-binding protein